MTKYFTNNFSVINLYKKPSVKSEVVTQMIYGESFSISKKSKKWLKEQRICAYFNIATYLTLNYTFCAPNLVGY